MKRIIVNFCFFSIGLKIGKEFNKVKNLYDTLGVFYQNCGTKFLVIKNKSSHIPSIIKLNTFGKIIAIGEFNYKQQSFFSFKKEYINLHSEVLFFNTPNNKNKFHVMLVENRNNQQKYLSTDSIFNKLDILWQTFAESIHINYEPDYYLMTNILPSFKEYNIYKMFYLLSKRGSVVDDNMYLNRNVLYNMGEIISKFHIHHVEYDGCGNDIFIYASNYNCDHGEYFILLILQFDKYCLLTSYFTFVNYCPECHKSIKNKLPMYQFEKVYDSDK